MKLKSSRGFRLGLLGAVPECERGLLLWNYGLPGGWCRWGGFHHGSLWRRRKMKEGVLYCFDWVFWERCYTGIECNGIFVRRIPPLHHLKTEKCDFLICRFFCNAQTCLRLKPIHWFHYCKHWPRLARFSVDETGFRLNSRLRDPVTRNRDPTLWFRWGWTCCEELTE